MTLRSTMAPLLLKSSAIPPESSWRGEAGAAHPHTVFSDTVQRTNGLEGSTPACTPSLRWMPHAPLPPAPGVPHKRLHPTIRFCRIVPVPKPRVLKALTPACPQFRSEEHTSELQSQSNLVC